MHIRKRTALHATQCLPCTCTARGYHPLVDLIPSTLRRNLRSLSEVPSTLRRNLRSIAVSFFLPCEHNNRKADRIAFLNNRKADRIAFLNDCSAGVCVHCPADKLHNHAQSQRTVRTGSVPPPQRGGLKSTWGEISTRVEFSPG